MQLVTYIVKGEIDYFVMELDLFLPALVGQNALLWEFYLALRSESIIQKVGWANRCFDITCSMLMIYKNNIVAVCPTGHCRGK
jgi:hypothetical protein